MPIAWVIEDDEHIAKLLCFILEREWFKVKHVPDGREAKRLVAQDAPPAILLMDIMLPYADGFELLAHMRTKPGWEKVRIMMLTAKGGERDIARALDSGADDYVVKPFQPDEIKARLRRLLRRTP
jgi:DNA-binding response OmpR family regulator